MRWHCLIGPLLALLTWVTLWPALGCGFVNYDDPRFVVENAYVRGGLTAEGIRWAFAPGATENWHPLTWLSLMLDAEIFGDPGTQGPHVARGYHATNLVLHTACVILLFVVLSRMTSAPWRSGAVSALFAIHPLHVESVAWVSERKDVLSTLFVLLSLAGYVRFSESAGSDRGVARTAWYAVSLAGFVCSMLSKQMYVTLPFLLLVLDYWPLARVCSRGASSDGQTWGRLAIEKLPFFAVAAAFCVVAYLAQRGGGTIAEHYTLSTRIANALVVYVLYLEKAVWPLRLAVFYPHPGNSIGWGGGAAACVFLMAVTGLAFGARRSRPYLVVGWLWYLGTLVPVIGLVQIGMQRMADRYTYFPLVGVFLAGVWFAWDQCGRGRVLRWACVACVVCAIAALGWIAQRQTTVWRDDFTLFRHAIDVTGENSIAENNLGIALRQAGRRDDAVRHFQEALRIEPNYAAAHNNLGIELFARGQREAAVGHFDLATQLNPNLAAARRNLARALAAVGDTEGARRHYEECLRRDPNDSISREALRELDRPGQ